MSLAVDTPVVSQGRTRALGLILAGAAFIYIEAMARLPGDVWGWQGTALRLMLTAGTLALALLAPPFQRGKDLWTTGWVAPATFAATIALWILAAVTESTTAAWLALVGYFAVSFWLAEELVDSRRSALAWVMRLVIGLGFVLAPIAFDQIAAHFADEEFFAALQAVQLAPWWFALEAGAVLLTRRVDRLCGVVLRHFEGVAGNLDLLDLAALGVGDQRAEVALAARTGRRPEEGDDDGDDRDEDQQVDEAVTHPA